MSLENFPKESEILIYDDTVSGTGEMHPSAIIYHGTVDYVPGGNLTGYFNVKLVYDPIKPVVQTKGQFINERFQIPIIVRPI